MPDQWPCAEGSLGCMLNTCRQGHAANLVKVTKLNVVGLDQVNVVHLQPFQTVMNTLCDCCRAEVELGLVISANFCG